MSKTDIYPSKKPLVWNWKQMKLGLNVRI